jgi:hypothetical protein
MKPQPEDHVMNAVARLAEPQPPALRVTAFILEDTLNTDEKRELAQHEVTIERGQRTVFEVAYALRQIREHLLYRETHKTFESYCDERWGFSKTHANRMIAGVSVVDDLTPIGAKPKNLEQTKPLARLKPDQRREAWAVAQEQAAGKEVTAFDLEQAATKVAPKVKPPAKEQLVKEKRARQSREQREKKRAAEEAQSAKKIRDRWEKEIVAVRSPGKEFGGMPRFMGDDAERALDEIVLQGESGGEFVLFRAGQIIDVVLWDNGSPVFATREEMLTGYIKRTT